MKQLKTNLSERIVFLKLKAGDSEAFSYFYEKYVNRIYRYVYIKVSDRTKAEDLTQDIFLRVWQHMIDKRHIRSFQAFIFRIARNAVIDHYRGNKKLEDSLEEIVEADNDNLQSNDQIEFKIDKSLDLQTLLDKLKTLRPDYQEIILLRFIEDLSIDEISQILQKNKTNVRVLVHRALNKLKQVLSQK